MTKKGIKRHEALHPLSHHHYHALVITLKLKQVGTIKSKLSVDEVKRETQYFWKHGGQEHFREEEEILLPAYAQFVAIEDDPIIAKMLMEHVEIRALMDSLENASVEGVHKLGKLLEAHVREEERVIFPMIEASLSEEKLKEVSTYLHANYRNESDH